MIKWRKINRILHRDMGYIFIGMTIIYAVSGIVLNHRSRSKDASFSVRTEEFQLDTLVSREMINKSFIADLVKKLNEKSHKEYYFPTSTTLMIYLDGGHIQVNLENGLGIMVKMKKRPLLWEFNFLHYNKPKRLWTWFSDIFAVSIIVIAITGLFMIKGKNGITGRGAILTIAGIIIPVIFLIFYLWSA